jgi:hypothetical protein
MVFPVAYPFMEDVALGGGYGAPVDGPHADENRLR